MIRLSGWAGRGERTRWVAIVAAVLGPFLLVALIDPRQPQNRVELLSALGVYLLPTVLGFLSAAQALRDLGREESLLARIDDNGKTLQNRLANSNLELKVDTDTWKQFVGGAETQGGVTRTGVRMVQSLCHEAASGRFPPISALAQVYAMELRDGARRLRLPQTLALRLGILGTFIGLLLALGGLGDMLAMATQRRLDTQELRPLVQSMMIAFGTSVAGLWSAIVVQLLGESLVRRQQGITKRVEDTIGRVVTVLSMTLTGSEVMRNLEAFGDHLARHRTGLADHAHEVRASMSAGVEAVERHGQSLDRGAAALEAAQGQFADALAQNQAGVERLQASIDSLGALDSRLARLFESSAQGRDRAVGHAIETASSTMRDALASVSTLLAQQAESTRTAGDKTTQALTELQTAARDLAQSGAALRELGPAVDKLNQAAEHLAQQGSASVQGPSRGRWVLVALTLLNLAVLAGMAVLVLRVTG